MDTSHPFTRAEAQRAGITPDQLRGPAYRRVFTGVYVAAAREPSAHLRAEAALRRFGPDAFASHATAARLLGVPLPALAAEHVSVPRVQDRRRTAGIVPHLCAAPEVVTLSGLKASSPRQLFVELASQLELVDLVVVGDHLVRRGLVSPESLIVHAGSSGLPRARAALRAARLVRAEVDSPMETRSRLLLRFGGLPEPTINLTFRNDRGDVLRRHEMAYEPARLFIEYDGRQHVDRLAQWESDLGRRELTDSQGWRTIVLIARDIYATPERTLARVHRALRERGMPGVPARLSDDWRPHFPGHGTR